MAGVMLLLLLFVAVVDVVTIDAYVTAWVMVGVIVESYVVVVVVCCCC